MEIAAPARSDLGPDAAPAQRVAQLRALATEFEAVFLAEMLRHAGLGAPQDSFGGGAGEEAFAGMMADAHARALAQAGGIGLAERVFQALLQREGTG
jgi:Rod binding domain-containing protein